jgi:acyl-CoA reductase-like NAD-dependent aldehyde dehydrogenase
MDAVQAIEIRCPADGRLVGTVKTSSRSEVAELAARLRAAQPEWEDLGPAGRLVVLTRFQEWLLDNERRLNELVQAESGKSWGDASLEVMVGVQTLAYYGKNAAAFLADRPVKGWGPAGLTKRLAVHVRPHQLIGIITPWNGPLAGPMLDVPAALAAGAAVLTKASEVAPLSWTEACRGWAEEICAPFVLANANGGPTSGEAVVDEADMVMFTGSNVTGRKVAVRAAERLIPCSLELGGKDPMIVLADADLERAASAAVWGAMFNAGQTCISVERVYVEAPAYEKFVECVTGKVRELRVGMDPAGSYTSEVGALTTAAQLATVERHVQDALAKGARALVGGRRGAGTFYEPTVLVDVDHSMACMREETFGPTLPIMRVDNEDEAVTLANDSPYGLSASVWSADPKRATSVARRLEAGAVNINNVLGNTFHFNLPMGGWKGSGIGSRAGGATGMLKYCRSQAQVSERVRMRREPYWYPIRPFKARLIVRGARIFGATDWRRRLRVRPPK